MGMYTAKMNEIHDIAKKLKAANKLESFLHIPPDATRPSPQPAQAPQPQPASKSDR